MKRTIILSAMFFLGALLLAACTTGGGPTPPQFPERTAVPMGTIDDPTDAVTLAPGATEHFSFDGDAASSDLIVIELDADLRLELTDRSGQTESATSTGPDVFRSPFSTPAAAGPETSSVDPAAIRVDPRTCLGSCIVIPATGGTHYFQVTNEGDATATANIYLYDAPFVDGNEPNDLVAEARGYFLGEEDSGAIETLGDVDYWQVGSADSTFGSILFAATGPVNIALFVEDLDGVEHGPYSSGTTVDVEVGELLRVESLSELAARGSPGYYYLSPAVTEVPLSN